MKWPAAIGWRACDGSQSDYRQLVTVMHSISGPPASPRHHALPLNLHHSADLLLIASTHAHHMS